MVFISKLFQQNTYINITKIGAALVYVEAIVVTTKYCSEKSFWYPFVNS